MTGDRANKYPGECRYCGENVDAGKGIVRRRDGRYGPWVVQHRPAEWHGSPVSGRYVGGCPSEADRLNAR